MQRLFYLIIITTLMLISCKNNKSASNDDYHNTLLKIKIGAKYGFIDINGKIVIEPQFDDACQLFNDSICFARIEDRVGLIDRDGNFICEIPDSSIYVGPFYDGIAVVSFENSANIINTRGELLLRESHKSIDVNWDEGKMFFIISDDTNKSRFITDKYGKMIGQPYDYIMGFGNGLCAVMHGDKWGYMDTLGKLVIDTIYNSARAFSKYNIARVRKDSTNIFINKSGEEILIFDEILTDFNCGRACVRDEGHLYLIDTSGNKICKVIADDISAFSEPDSVAIVIRNGNYSLIDTNGKDILTTNHEAVGWIYRGLAVVEKNGKCGVIDKKGAEIVKAEFDVCLIYPDLMDDLIILGAKRNSQGGYDISYFNADGTLIGKDMPTKDYVLPEKPEKEDFIRYFDSKLSELDDIEGLYYITSKDYFESRNNTGHIGLNSSNSRYSAIIKNKTTGDYIVYATDGTNYHWVNKFVRIGNTNDFAIVKVEKSNTYSSEGKMTMTNPGSFEFRLERGHNDYYNYFVTYEFIKDYPTNEEYEKLQQVDWTGTGFAIADGYIVTNYHVTNGAKYIRIKGINGEMDESYKAVVVASDKDHDLSILRVVDKDFETLGNIPYKIGREIVDVGNEIFVLGYPLVESMGYEIKLTEGIISASSGYKGDESMYQISAAVQPGNSGGPLFSENGTVIGIVCAKHNEAENANYAIKISYLNALINAQNLDIKLSDNQIKDSRLNKKIKKIKSYVYLIECSSK